jgi:gamma-glutamyltranspeptidase/glutathione hydrolase
MLFSFIMASSFKVKVNWSQVNNLKPIFQKFPSRRSVVYGTKGVVSSSQPLATEAGLEVLRKGGNAGMDTIVQFRRIAAR